MARLLIVEDEPKIASFLTRAFSGEGFGVDSAPDGAQGLKLALTGTYDLVLLDLMLPEMNGVTLLRRLIEQQPDQLVVVLSAIADARAIVRCLKLGACDYVTKPFALEELVERVRKRLERPTVFRADRFLRVGRATLDLHRRTVDLGPGPISLATREFLLLQYLMAHAGDVCTRESLLADVWGYSFDPGSSVLEVYVARLRAKLGSRVIETVRNVGYGFGAELNPAPETLREVAGAQTAS